ncbi:hypothetical protein [Pedobacter sp. Leaf170]|uniref:hypothetical protein n=1 Tax=Pedobacter sp. Leaf170 TaxID=2876558 RepID=UPI001E2E7EEB|nr:hypothetical protein [Pedobacter sp. Leaf170]
MQSDLFRKPNIATVPAITHGIQKHGFDINQTPSKKRMDEIKEETRMLDEFMPMCVGCKAMSRNQLNLEL